MSKLVLAVGMIAALTGPISALGDDGTAQLQCKTISDGVVSEPVTQTVTVPQSCISVISPTLTPTMTVREALPAFGFNVGDIAEEIFDIELQHLAEQHKADIVRAMTPPQLVFDEGAAPRHTNAKAAHDRWQEGATKIVESLMIEAGALQA